MTYNNFNDELSLEKIDDYNNSESKEKRNIIYKVIVGGLIVGAIIGFLKYNYSVVDDYIGTPQNPGINTSKGH